MVCEHHTYVLVDCGFSVAQIEKRLARLAIEPHNLHAIVLTHEHADHFGSAGPLSRKYRIPVWLTHGTHATRTQSGIVDPHYFHAHAQFELGDLIARPFPVVHDAREPCQFVFDNYDPKLLRDGPYPRALIARISSAFGHLSNDQAGELLQRLQSNKLRHLVAAHLSEQNNRSELALEALATGCGCNREDVLLAGQETGTGWLEI